MQSPRFTSFELVVFINFAFILLQISSLTTLALVWSVLEKIYLSGSDRRVLWLKCQLQSIKKESLSIDEYLGQITILKDALITYREIALITLDGLSQDYDSFVTSVITSTRTTNPILFSELGNVA